MNNGKILNTIGLVFGLVGVVIIFIWGPPQPQLEEGVGRGLENDTPIDENGKTVGQFNKEVRHKKKSRHNLMSRVGLGFIFFVSSSVEGDMGLILTSRQQKL